MSLAPGASEYLGSFDGGGETTDPQRAFGVLGPDPGAAVNDPTQCRKVTDVGPIYGDGVSGAPYGLVDFATELRNDAADAAQWPPSHCSCVLPDRLFESQVKDAQVESLQIPSALRLCIESNVAITEAAHSNTATFIDAGPTVAFQECSLQLRRFLARLSKWCSKRHYAHQLSQMPGDKQIRFFEVIGKWKVVHCLGSASKIRICQLRALLRQVCDGTLTLHFTVDYADYPGCSHCVSVFLPHEVPCGNGRTDWRFGIVDAAGGCKKHGPLRWLHLSSLVHTEENMTDDWEQSPLDLCAGVCLYTLRDQGRPKSRRRAANETPKTARAKEN